MIVFFQLNCKPKSQNEPSSGNPNFIEKQKGAHVFSRFYDSTNFEFLHRNNIEWITIVPWSSQKESTSPILSHHNGDSTLIKKTNANWIRMLEVVHEAGFKIFVKPHIWITDPSDGEWRSDIFPTSEDNWLIWADSYRDFVLRYARLAEIGKAEMFCIGTELSRLAVERPYFWQSLIQEIRKEFSGKLTYAANWDQEFEEVRFWNDLDYIGIQAYFPLAQNDYPSTKQITKGWQQYIPTLAALHKQYDRQILFTEMGYKSTADSAIQPWRWINQNSEDDWFVSVETQSNCYQAFFDCIWPKQWFAGVHIWQMRDDYQVRPQKMSYLDFTPLGKPAERIIAFGFK